MSSKLAPGRSLDEWMELVIPVFSKINTYVFKDNVLQGTNPI